MTELVSKGHPDKLADLISEVVVKNCKGKVACETLITGNTIIIAGEVTNFSAGVYDAIREALKKVGYSDNWNIVNYTQKQSEELAKMTKANDQSIAWGYACKEKYYMPKEYGIAYDALLKLEDPRLEPDKKILVDGNKISVSVSHKGSVEDARKVVRELLGEDVIVNPAGSFTIYGPYGDTGVTGRKLACDFYGQNIPIGGGALFGKDMSKMDKSMALYARKKAIEVLQKFDVYEVKVKCSCMIGDEFFKVQYLDETEYVSVDELNKLKEPDVWCPMVKYVDK